MDVLREISWNLLRIVSAFVFWQHGADKLFALLGGMNGEGATAEPLTRMWFAGVIEFVGGILIALGLFTQPVAFITSGEMAAAYFLAHAPNGFWPMLNRGELAVVLCFVFLFFAFHGPGAWSLDRALRRKGSGERGRDRL